MPNSHEPSSGSSTQVQSHYAGGTNPVTTLYIQRSGNDAVLTWAPGTLQSATNVLGPYTDVSGALSPYTVTPSEAQPYYRVRVR
jgi:hypothetical protein